MLSIIRFFSLVLVIEAKAFIWTNLMFSPIAMNCYEISMALYYDFTDPTLFDAYIDPLVAMSGIDFVAVDAADFVDTNDTRIYFMLITACSFVPLIWRLKERTDAVFW